MKEGTSNAPLPSLVVSSPIARPWNPKESGAHLVLARIVTQRGT